MAPTTWGRPGAGPRSAQTGVHGSRAGPTKTGPARRLFPQTVTEHGHRHVSDKRPGCKKDNTNDLQPHCLAAAYLISWTETCLRVTQDQRAPQTLAATTLELKQTLCCFLSHSLAPSYASRTCATDVASRSCTRQRHSPHPPAGGLADAPSFSGHSCHLNLRSPSDRRSSAPRGPSRERALTRGLENPAVALAVPLGERLHHPVDLLGLPGQPEAPQKLPGGEGGSVTGGGSLLPPNHSTSGVFYATGHRESWGYSLLRQ